jgi:CheY-like chemotaxis protein
MTQRKTLLIVDDEPSIRNLLQDVLQHRGYTVLTAGSGEEALIICNKPDLHIECSLTDCQMPGMSY